ncbi:MAG TPA: alcohol dehydrogenase catalytic domain-containing protein [Bacteroidota bacterium]|nr:alcohol dehydrogenase catalytic domain-containing protein [Bacteroidota bacterium]
MNAALLTGIGSFEIRQVPEPVIRRDTDVLVRIAAVGVCGSDVHYFTHGRIGSQVVSFPFVIGHEAAGTVVDTGSSVETVRAGERIAIDPAMPCGHCDQCSAGREHTCRTLRFMGTPGQMEGSLAEYVVIPERSCYPVPDNVPFDEAALCEPLAIAVYAVERSHSDEGCAVAILGAGPIGMSVLHVLRTTSVGKVYVTDRIGDRLAFAASLRPAWCGNPERDDVIGEVSAREPLLLDVVYECSGDPAALRQGIELLKPGGRLVIIGIPAGDEISLPVHELRRKELTITSIRRQVRCTGKAIDLVAARRVNLAPMATHHFGLAQTQEAFELVAGYRDGVMKAIISVT